MINLYPNELNVRYIDALQASGNTYDNETLCNRYALEI